jgi:hypothetical protein
MTIKQEVLDRVLARHLVWENGGTYRRCAGNFDGQVMSLGTLQFAAKNGPLIILIRDYLTGYEAHARMVLGADYDMAKQRISTDALMWLDGLNAYPGEKRRDNYIVEPWKSRWEIIANSAEWQAAERPYIQTYFDQAEADLWYFESNSQEDTLITDRAFDLCFEAACALGGLPRYPLAETAYLDKLKAIVYAIITSASSEWAVNVQKRAMAIVTGSGVINGQEVSLTYTDRTIYEETDMTMETGMQLDNSDSNSINTKEDTNMPKFTDVPAGHWAAKAIERLGGYGIMLGKGDGNFHPDDLLTRAELAMALDRAIEFIASRING